MRFFIFLFLFLPFILAIEVLAIEVSEFDDYVIVTNNRNLTANYTVVSDSIEVFSLTAGESRILMPGSYEIKEDIGTNLIASAYIGGRDIDEYSDLKVIGVALFLSLLIFIAKIAYKEFRRKK